MSSPRHAIANLPADRMGGAPPAPVGKATRPGDRIEPGPSVREERRLARGLAAVAAGAATLAVALAPHGSGDYQGAIGPSVSDNAAPAINALADGRLHAFLALHPYMGSFSLLLRAPFVGVARALGAGDLVAYRIGAIVCVAGLALLAIRVGRLIERKRPIWRLIVIAALVLNPLTFDAIWLGHPEEPLAAALCVSAVLAARNRRIWPAGVLLGLALATKQWAIVAVAPVLIAAPERRLRLAGISVVVAVALVLPLAAGDPARLEMIAREASQTLRAPPTSVWAPFAEAHRRVYVSGTVWIVTSYSIPPSLGWLPRPLIVVTTALVAAIYWRKRQPDGVLGLLALCFLLRGMLDPISPAYYYVPFVVALGTWEGLRRRGPPLLTVACVAALWLLFQFSSVTGPLARHRTVATDLYLLWSVSVAAVIIRRLSGAATVTARRRFRFAP